MISMLMKFIKSESNERKKKPAFYKKLKKLNRKTIPLKT